MVIALHNQSLIDLAIQQSGLATNWLEIAMANDLVPTNEVTAGTYLEIPVFETVDTDIIQFLEVRNLKPATANNNETLIPVAVLTCQEQIENCFK